VQRWQYTRRFCQAALLKSGSDQERAEPLGQQILGDGIINNAHISAKICKRADHLVLVHAVSPSDSRSGKFTYKEASDTFPATRMIPVGPLQSLPFNVALG
jgi:hypothetical protein